MRMFIIIQFLCLLGTVFCEEITTNGTVQYVMVWGDKANLGYVHVYNGSGWYSLCSDGWDFQDAAVVCRMLGYTGDDVQLLYNSIDVKPYVIWGQQLDCIGSETSLHQCETSTMTTDCTSGKFAGVNCSLEKEPEEFFLVHTELGIGRMDTKFESITVIKSNASTNVTDIEYDEVEKMVIWSDLAGNIFQCSINGGEESVIYQREPLLNKFGIICLAVDSISRFIFYTDIKRKEIGAIDADTLIESVVIGTDIGFPVHVALYSYTGEIFWTDPERKSIEKALYNGSSREIIVDTELIVPAGLVVDDLYLFWCDRKKDVMERIFRNGTGRTLLYTTGFMECFDLTLYQEYIYVTNLLPS